MNVDLAYKGNMPCVLFCRQTVMAKPVKECGQNENHLLSERLHLEWVDFPMIITKL